MIMAEPLLAEWKLWLFLGVLGLVLVWSVINLVVEVKQLKQLEAMLDDSEV